MKGPRYYLNIWVSEFGDRMNYHTNRGNPIKKEEMDLIRDLDKCKNAADYLDPDTLEAMKEALIKGFSDRDMGEFARGAKMGAKMGKKWCVDILILAIEYARTEGTELIRDATYSTLAGEL